MSFLWRFISSVKLGSHHPLTDVLNVITGRLKVSCCIIGTVYKDLAFCSQIFWYKEVTDANEFLLTWFQELQGWSDFLLRLLGLHCCAGDGDVLPLCGATLCAEEIMQT